MWLQYQVMMTMITKMVIALKTNNGGISESSNKNISNDNKIDNYKNDNDNDT